VVCGHTLAVSLSFRTRRSRQKKVRQQVGARSRSITAALNRERTVAVVSYSLGPRHGKPPAESATSGRPKSMSFQ
jgi:hypothetical protein